MTTLRKVLPFTLLALVALWTFTSHHSPIKPISAYAQATDCTSTFQFTGNATGQTVNNLSQNTPCVNWRVTLSTTGTLSSTVTFQTSPDASVWTAVPNTLCAAAAQPPCIFQGANPIVGTQGMVYMAAYGSYVRVVTTGSSGTGTGTIRLYGAKGATANNSVSNGAGSGTVTNVSFTGGLISVANPTTAPALTVAGTSGGIPYFSSASTWASSGALTQYFAILGGGAGNPPTSSVIKDDGTAVTITQNAVVPFTMVAAGAVANTLYCVAGSCGIGIAGPIGPSAGREYLAIKGTTNIGVLQLSTGAADSATNMGNVEWYSPANVRSALINSALFGTTANNRGAAMTFTVKGDGTAAFPAMQITTTGALGIGNTLAGNNNALYALDVSGASGLGINLTARFFDQTATTGSTLVTITPGAAQTAASTVLSVGGVASFASINNTTSSFLFNGHTCTIVATVVTCP